MKLAFLLTLIPFSGFLFAIGVPIQTFSAFAIVSILGLFYWITKIQKSTILTLIILLYIYLLLVSMVNIWINQELLSFFIRQFISLNIGIMIFLFLRYIFIVSKDEDILKYSLWGFYSVTIFAILDILNHNYRIVGTFSEPSHLGQYLVFIMLPVLIVFREYLSKIHYIALLSLLFLELILTYSSTSFVRLGLVLLFLFFFAKKVKLLTKVTVSLFVVLIGFGLYYYLFVYNLDNYMAHMINLSIDSINNGTRIPLSIVDRISLWYMLSNFHFDIYAIFGYGLGGEAYYYPKIFQKEIVDQIAPYKQFGFFLNAMWAKLLADGGMVAVLMYLALTIVVVSKVNRLAYSPFLKTTMVAIFTYMTMGMGGFVMIEVWFWIAFIDARSILQERQIR